MTDKKLDQTISDWLEAERPGPLPDRVLRATFERTRNSRQQVGWRVLLGRLSMPRFAPALASAAVVLVVAVVAVSFYVNEQGIGGPPTASPSPSPVLLARGNFFIRDWDRVEFEARREGSRVTGRMVVGLDAERRLGQEHASDLLSVDLQCARTTEDGLLMIGGYTDGAEGRFAGTPDGTLAAIALKRGSPVKAQIWRGSLTNAPATQTTDCLAYLDAWLTWSRTSIPGDEWLRDDIEGTVEFGQSDAGPSVEPSPAADLPVGPHVMVSTVGANEDRVTVTIPAPGWSAEPDEGSLTKDMGGDDRVTVVKVPGDHYRIPRDLCNWRDPGYRRAGTVDEFVAYLAEQTYDTPEGSTTRDLTTPVDITLDGYPGQSITGAVPRSDPTGCDEQRFCSLTDRDGGRCLVPHVEPDALVTMWIADSTPVNPPFWVVAATYWPTTSSELLAEMNAIVDSMTLPFDPDLTSSPSAPS